MEKFEQNREQRLNQLLIVIKLALMFFSAIAFSQHYFNNKDILSLLSNGSKTIIIFVCILVSIYIVAIFLNNIDRSLYSKIFEYGEITFFGILSFATIFFTGAFDSNFKPLFLCVILLATIGNGLMVGMITASTLTGGLLLMDLVMAPSHPVNLYFEYDLILSCVFILVTFTVGYYAKLEQEHIKELRQIVNIDALTGLYNHRYFYSTLYKQIKEATEFNKSVSLIFLDIDDFKIYNDLYGHTSGDEALKKISEIIKEELGEKYITCRYGGEEFGILLYDTVENEALIYANQLCQKIAKEYFYGQEYLPKENLTVSVGVSSYPNKAKEPKDLVNQADEALYRAKFFQKNRVESYASILENLKSSLKNEDETIITTLRTLISVINSRDKYTYDHVERVAEYANWMAEALEFSKEEKQTLVYGAYMHDIGKINTSKEVLLKTGKLSLKEWEELKMHPIQGVEIIEHVETIKDVQPLILEHHEHYNGGGYPYGLKGDEISFMSRILSVVDAFDAMTSMRPYQEKRTIENACRELYRCRGTQFDPYIVEVFIKIIIEKLNIKIDIFEKK